MQSTSSNDSNVRAFPPIRAYHKVEFPRIDHFLDDVMYENVKTVRLDLFEEVQASQLSFVQYVTLSLVATAQDASGFVVFEYVEPIATVTSTESTFTDEVSRQAGLNRLNMVATLFESHGLQVRKGRFALPIIQQNYLPNS